MKKSFFEVITVFLLVFLMGCGGGSSDDGTGESYTAKDLQEHILKLIGIPQSIVMNICQDKNANGRCDVGELQAKVTLNKGDSLQDILAKAVFEDNGDYIITNYDENLSIIMELNGAANTNTNETFNDIKVSLKYKPTSTELSVLQAIIDADFLKEEEVVKLKALDNREKIDEVLLKSLTQNQEALIEENLSVETALVINLEEIAKGLKDLNVSDELPEQLEDCNNDNTCIEAIVENAIEEIPLTQEEVEELARSKKVADGYIVKLFKPLNAVCANGKEYNSSLTVEAQGSINFEKFPVGTDCNITVFAGTILDSNNNEAFDENDSSLAFDMIGAADDTFISPLTTLLHKKKKNGENVSVFEEMIQNYNPVVAPSRAMSNSGIEKLKIEKLIILMEVLKTAMKQAEDISKLNLSKIVTTRSTEKVDEFDIDLLINGLSDEGKASVKERAGSIQTLVMLLETLDASKINLDSFFVSVSDGGKSITDALTMSLLKNVTLPNDVNILNFILGVEVEASVKEEVVKGIAAINNPPIAKAGLNKTTINKGESVTLDASASSDSDGTIKSYEWIENEKSIGAEKSLTLSSLSVGVHTISLIVKDNDNAISSDVLTITVNNKAPIANAGADQSIIEDESVTLDASASFDSDGVINHYEWFKNGLSLGTGKSITIDSLSAGTHTIFLFIKDDDNAIASDPVIVTVKRIEGIPFSFPSTYFESYSKKYNGEVDQHEVEIFGFTAEKEFFYIIYELNNGAFVEKSNDALVFENGLWNKESFSTESFLRDTQIRINETFQMRVKGAEEVGGEQFPLDGLNESITMPEGTTRTTFTVNILKNRYGIDFKPLTEGKTENTYYSSLQELVEYQCGTHHIKSVNNSTVVGISFTCGQEGQSSGTLVGVTSGNSLVENVGTWQKSKLENSNVEVIILDINEQYKDNIEYPLFTLYNNVVWGGQYEKAGTSFELEGYSDGFVQAIQSGTTTSTNLSGIISKETRLTADKTWYLDGKVEVASGTTLSIEAGTTIVGKDANSWLLVNAGAKIIAEGQFGKEIVFRGSDAVSSGEWGGIVIIGNHTNTQITNGYEHDASLKAGTNKNSSGSLNYVLINNTGSLVLPNTKMNGLSLFGISLSTLIENITVNQSANNGIEIWGGSVNLGNIVIDNSNNDSFSTDDGWEGTVDGLKITNGKKAGIEMAGNTVGVYRNVQITLDASDAEGGLYFNADEGEHVGGTFENIIITYNSTANGAITLGGDFNNLGSSMTSIQLNGLNNSIVDVDANHTVEINELITLFNADNSNTPKYIINKAPVASEQNVTTDEDSSVSITLTASDEDNDSLSYRIVNSPSNGTLSGVAPNLSYIPDADYNGTDNFSFKVNDTLLDSNIGSISITILAVNDAPLANEQNLTTDENRSIDINLTASDVEGNTLSYTLIDSPSHGSLSGIAPNLIYTADVNYSGEDNLTFIANDGFENSNIAMISIVVKDVVSKSGSSLIKKTGQTKSYNDEETEVLDNTLKDDGHYQRGVDTNYTRDNAKEIVIDELTGLMWQDDEAVTSLTKPWLTQENSDAQEYNNTIGDTATTYCEELSLGGFEDWHLPTRKELVGIVDYGRHDPAISSTFVYKNSSDYWSSTSNLENNDSAWFVYFYSGLQANDNVKKRSYYVRCVRGGQ